MTNDFKNKYLIVKKKGVLKIKTLKSPHFVGYNDVHIAILTVTLQNFTK